ncbi:hypothetical protein SAMN05661044_00675 [Olivibacter domesticus]|uniref:Uncharacterized protein n=1 Tax=Olivibacter domesticus TaxID=407022 RepID=A0A1H7IEF4_OLID1|nr:hypothetical protein SAMN05661044_00675 [Olivibacter domesticus]
MNAFSNLHIACPPQKLQQYPAVAFQIASSCNRQDVPLAANGILPRNASELGAGGAEALECP